MTDKAKTITPEEDMEKFEAAVSATQDMKDLLAIKINSLAKFERVAQRASLFGYSMGAPGSDVLAVHSRNDVLESLNLRDHTREDSWWLLREFYREKFEVYSDPPALLRRLRTYYGGCGVMFPHVSTEDRSMVAFTPDRQAGEADRQIKMTVGRFMRKFMPLWSDTYISTLEAAYRAELDGTFEIAETAEDVFDVYTKMSGDSGCMRYKPGQWGQQVHPSAVYAAPQYGIRVAYLRDTQGVIKARSVIYDNPNDPADKRYVRVYGDSTLTSRLKRAGYRMAGLNGARIPAIDPQRIAGTGGVAYDREGHMVKPYLMPYMDPPGGSGSGCSDQRADYAYKVRGEDFLHITNDGDAIEQKFGSGRNTYASVLCTAGYIMIKELFEGMDSYVCALTGVTARRNDSPPVTYYDAEGAMFYPVREEALPPGFVCLTRAKDNPNGTRTAESVRVHPDYAEKARMKQEHLRHLWNDAVTRSANGVVELDPEFYGDEQYAMSYDTNAVFVWDGKDAAAPSTRQVVMREGDWVQVIDVGNEAAFKAHVSHCKELAKHGYIAVAPVGKDKYMCHKDNPNLVTMGNKRRMVVGHHELRRLADGAYAATRGTTTTRIFGVPMHIRSGCEITGIHPEVAYVALTGWSYNTLVAGRNHFEHRGLRCGLGLNGYGGYYVPEDQSEPVRFTAAMYNAGDIPARERFIAAMDWILAATPDALQARFTTEAGNAKVWAQTSKVFLDQIDVRVRKLIADKEAADDHLLDMLGA